MRSLGNDFEEAACRFLSQKGYKIVDRNVRLGRKEIDIVATYGDTIVFVEVKGRLSARFGRASESVDLRKQERILQVARYYLEKNGMWDRNVRFDVVCLESNQSGDFEISHIENAFGDQ